MRGRRENKSVAKISAKRFFPLWAAWSIVLALGAAGAGPEKTQLRIKGLREPVEIIKDKWGIAHIYARNQSDLFFAQGFNVASDRLFQLEMWRRQATGTVAEILGEKALPGDIGARLLNYRGDMRKELASYHPDGEEIVTAFVGGINAYVDRVVNDQSLLPVEFRLLGILPGRWTPEVVVSRHNGLFGNATDEIRLIQEARAVGPERLGELLDFHPGSPDLRPAEGLQTALLADRVLDLYLKARSPLRFTPEDIADAAARSAAAASSLMPLLMPYQFEAGPPLSEGSNNWAVSGRLTRSGFPFLANDPHRALQIPSLRYWVHLTAPGWNVIGGGEPALPGVSIGHNGQGAWGLTIFETDQEDLYVYDTDPENPERYRYSGAWEEMTVMSERIPVKGASPAEAKLKFTRHGPVIYQDGKNRLAVALHAAWLVTGCAPYLASLRMDQAGSWPEFRDACFKNRTPSENMLWADRKGNIGWQATGLVPVRKNWSGLLPVPGDGRYEWSGTLPASELPGLLNPESGFIATANQDNLPEGYPHQVSFLWADPFRFLRIAEVLSSGRTMSLADMQSLQQDVLSLPARRLVPLLKGLDSSVPLARKALDMLTAWDYFLSPESPAAAIYVTWEKALLKNLRDTLIPEDARSVFEELPLHKAISRLEAPDARFGSAPAAGRDQLLIHSLEQAVLALAERLGPDPGRWRYGDPLFHHVRLYHPLGAAIEDDLRKKLDLGPYPRGGNGQTVNNTSGRDNQSSGATFRLIADLSDWDLSVGTNAPGQSGDPEDRHYSDLFLPWAEGKYFPVYFSRAKIEAAAEKVVRLEPIELNR
jgi:penicillin G amidase